MNIRCQTLNSLLNSVSMVKWQPGVLNTCSELDQWVSTTAWVMELHGACPTR